MRRIILLSTVLLLLLGSLCGCLPKKMMVIPDEESIGEAKTFEKAGLTITLTDEFVDQASQLGFDAYYVTDFCGVVVLKEEFSMKEGMAEESLEEYVNNVIKNNGHTDITAQYKDGLWFYEHSSSGGNFVRSYSYKGSDAFYIVQFICRASDAETLGDTFYLWAQSVKVK